jgi:hypothetical protein
LGSFSRWNYLLIFLLCVSINGHWFRGRFEFEFVHSDRFSNLGVFWNSQIRGSQPITQHFLEWWCLLKMLLSRPNAYLHGHLFSIRKCAMPLIVFTERLVS